MLRMLCASAAIGAAGALTKSASKSAAIGAVSELRKARSSSKKLLSGLEGGLDKVSHKISGLDKPKGARRLQEEDDLD